MEGTEGLLHQGRSAQQRQSGAWREEDVGKL